MKLFHHTGDEKHPVDAKSKMEAKVRSDLAPYKTAHPADNKLKLTVLVPAHNEQATIGQTLSSLWKQTRKPDYIIVIADNCTDATAEIARANGASVFETINNQYKKAGGLNQVLRNILPKMDASDIVMVMDADTVIVPRFLEVAMGKLEQGYYDCIGGVFYGEGGVGLIGALQRNEYTRYSRDISRHQGRVLVLTGTASLFRALLMDYVATARGIRFPGKNGEIYDTISLTEDNEMTLAVKAVGAKIISPMQCKTITEVMPNWTQLWRQRMRWQRGALDNIKAYGFTRTTLRYWGQQFGLGYGTFALNLYFLVMTIDIFANGLQLVVLWMLIGCIFILERVATVWKGGWTARLLAAPLIIELGYDLFLQAVYVKSLFDLATGRKPHWGSSVRTKPANTGTKVLLPSRTVETLEHSKQHKSTSWIPLAIFPVFLGLIIVLVFYVVNVDGISAGSILAQSTVFQIAISIVAFNTILYAILSLGKIIPRKKG